MKIVHTADWHLAYRQYGFAQREEDFFRAAEHVVRRTIDMKADLLIIAGDLFDMPKPPAYAVRRVSRMIRDLHDAGIEVIGVDGNHDATGMDWLHVCGIRPVSADDAYKYGGITIRGLSGCRPTMFWKAVDNMVAEDKKCDVFILHQSLGEFADFEAQAITAMELAPKLGKLGVKYVAMGDIHAYKEIELAGIRFTYPGAIEVNAIDEPHDKVFSIIDIEQADGGINMSTSFEPIPTRPIVDFQLHKDEDVDNLLAEIGDTKPLTVLWYDADRRDLAKRAEALLLERGIMQRACPIAASSLDDITAQLTRQQFERKGALMQLKDAVSAFFDDDSDEYQLVFQLLDAPDSVEDILRQCMQYKGVAK
jgi:DNA repair exonuclease SbcCD nuclease subunit